MLGIPQEDEEDIEIDDWRSFQAIKNMLELDPEFAESVRKTLRETIQRPPSEKVKELIEDTTIPSPPKFTEESKEELQPTGEKAEEELTKLPAPAPVPLDVAKQILPTVAPGKQRFIPRTRFR